MIMSTFKVEGIQKRFFIDFAVATAVFTLVVVVVVRIVIIVAIIHIVRIMKYFRMYNSHKYLDNAKVKMKRVETNNTIMQ